MLGFVPARSLRSTLPRLVAVTVLGACSNGPASDADRTGSASQAIEGGHFINDEADVVSTLFPLSTVNVRINVGTSAAKSCTGVLIAADKVLTAAHCTYGTGGVLMDDLTVAFYTPGIGGGAAPVATTAQVVPQTSVAKPPNVTCAPWPPGDPPASCFSNGVYADLAVLTLTTPVGSPWRPVYLAPKGAVAALVAAKTSRASWEVGTGYENYDKPHCQGILDDDLPDPVKNAARLMQWVPVASFSNGGATGIISDNVYGDRGDSGGPLYQYAGIGDHLALLGTLSLSAYGCSVVQYTHYNRYPDVTEPSNYDWLVAHGATEMPTTGSFGGAL
jgi:hypothetical protein